MLTRPAERGSTPSRSVTTSCNGPDRAGLDPDLCVALLFAAETKALVLVCLRIIPVLSPDMVVLGH